MRHIISVLAASLFSLALMAVPAKPGSFHYVQPDGSVIELILQGDEYCHWMTDVSGHLMEQDVAGYYRRSDRDISAMREEGLRRRRMSATSSLRAYNPEMSKGERRILVVLVNFKDVKFTINDPATAFHNLLNQEGYSANGGTGSVKDYYVENSGGQFVPIFDVYGPVDLDNDMEYYGGNDTNGNDKRPEVALYHACKILDDTVDFSQYDSNGDELVDMILFYYAGYNEAERGPADSIWPHQYSVQHSSDKAAKTTKFDGVKLGNYFCTSEYKGNSGKNMCGIGSTCHEFAHSIGLPDFYDTDYGTNGEAGGLYEFSLMCSGCYNNDGRTPPYLGIVERAMLGWAEEPGYIYETRQFFLPSVANNVGLKIATTTSGETFYLECRDGQGWDSYIPAGMLVYHQDMSDHEVKLPRYTVTAKELWENWNSYNYINGNGSHPCFYIVPASDQSSLYYFGGKDRMVFPGKDNVTAYVPKDWNKEEGLATISDIAYSGGVVSFNAVSKINSDPAVRPELHQMGYAWISSEDGVLTLMLPEEAEVNSATWYVDGESYATGIDPLTPDFGQGSTHSIEVEIVYADGHVDVVECAYLTA